MKMMKYQITIVPNHHRTKSPSVTNGMCKCMCFNCFTNAKWRRGAVVSFYSRSGFHYATMGARRLSSHTYPVSETVFISNASHVLIVPSSSVMRKVGGVWVARFSCVRTAASCVS
jgi:hypothetical protein